MNIVNNWGLLFFIQLIAFFVIIIVITCEYDSELDIAKEKSKTMEILHRLDLYRKDMIIKKQEEELNLAYTKIKKLTDKIKRIKRK